MDQQIESNESSIAQSPTGRSFSIPAAIIGAGALIAFAIVYTNLRNSVPPLKGSAQVSGASEPQPPLDPNDLKALEDDDPFLGSPNAPVSIVEFGDFQCPFCRRFSQSTAQQIIEAYVKTGHARFVYRDFPITSIHGEAQKSAEAAQCAHEQGKFWQYQDILYERQSELGMTNYKQWAAELGLDTAQFNACLDSGKYAEEVNKDARDGAALGVNGTPATFVNGTLITGAVPFFQFQAVIEEALKKTPR